MRKDIHLYQRESLLFNNIQLPCSLVSPGVTVKLHRMANNSQSIFNTGDIQHIRKQVCWLCALGSYESSTFILPQHTHTQNNSSKQQNLLSIQECIFFLPNIHGLWNPGP